MQDCHNVRVNLEKSYKMVKCPAPAFSSILLVFEVILLLLFATLGDYGQYQDSVVNKSVSFKDSNSLLFYYPMFQDVHVMVFFGIGFLMTFLKKYGYGSVSYTLLIAALMVQWSTLVNCWMGQAFDGVLSGKFTVDIKTILSSDFAAATVLISWGAVIGKVSCLQLLIIGVFEVIFYSVNANIVTKKLSVTDAGCSITIHAFAAYFGLAIARIIRAEDKAEESPSQASSYTSDLFSLIGTIFLWLYWPSFNAALLEPGIQRDRAVINTYFSLTASVILTFVISPLVSKDGKTSIAHVQNSTLAGGVAVGTMANLVIHPWGALLIGAIAATITTLGFVYITPFLSKRMKIHDSCGVHSLHGLPGIFAAIGGSVVAAVANERIYGNDLYAIWPARKSIVDANNTVIYTGRTAGAQAGFQLIALLITIGVAILGGIVTGFTIKHIDPLSKAEYYNDASFFVMPDECKLEEDLKLIKKEDKRPLIYT